MSRSFRLAILALCFLPMRLAPAQPSPAPAGNLALPPEAAAWNEREKDLQRERAARMVVELTRAVATGKHEFTIPPGDYRFGPGPSPSFEVKGAKDFTIEAKGVTFWFPGRTRIQGVRLVDCVGLTFKGLTIDYDPFSCSQGEITAIDPVAKTVDLRIDPGFALPEPDWTSRVGDIKAVFFKPDGTMRETRMDWIKSLAPRGGRDFRVSFKDNALFTYATDVQVGDRLALPDRTSSHALNVQNGERVTLEDITFYGSPHMAIAETNGEGGNVYRRIRVVRRPGTGRLVACNADVFHSIRMRKGPLIEDCEFSFSCDDAVNVHSFYSVVIEQRSPTSVVVGMFFSRDISPGTPLRFYDFATGALIGGGPVKQITDLDDKALLESFKAIPAELKQKGFHVTDFTGRYFWTVLVELDRPLALHRADLVESYERAAQGTIIRRNHIHDIFTRGLLLKGRDLLVEDNRLERTGLSAIMVANDRIFWEAPVPEGIRVQHNQISDSPFALGSRLWENGYQGAITVFTSNPASGHDLALVQNENITVSGNTITRPAHCGIFMANTKDSRIEGNRIVAPVAKAAIPQANPELAKTDYAVFVTVSRDVAVTGNVVEQATARCLGPLGLGKRVERVGPAAPSTPEQR